MAEDIQKERAKREQLEAQQAGAWTGFNTLKQAGLLSEEEQTKFMAGNANQQNAIVMAATPRLVQKFREKQDMDQERRFQAQQAQELMLARMRYADPAMSQPQVDPATGMAWNGKQWVMPTAEMIEQRDAYMEAQEKEKNGPGFFDRMFGGGKEAKPAAPAPPVTPPPSVPSNDLKALAEKALTDPKATEAHKARARQILGLGQ